MNYYFYCFKKYANFNERAGRKEFWFFSIFNFISLLLATTIDLIVSRYPILCLLYLSVVLIPSLAVTVRRLHDINRSGKYLLLPLIPFAGSIWLLILMVKESDKGTNNYGDSPRLEKKAKQEEKGRKSVIW